MALSYKARRRWSLFLLLVWLPLFVVVAVTVTGLFERPPIWLEVAIYAGLGLIWALPFRAVFRGVGREDPEAGAEDAPDSSAEMTSDRKNRAE
ncbi:DUF2842 domain-containing protein [Albimonas sp. CAU 1670]|uniref:DUF2842 domain-containing protein n=1 Tax=Albimonas sp. CAU 1670 TaxID=3032599 RepID=UPI0023DCCD70|nr:DUF2842 domain-containing protein [Albimonas sp. CAU 1670]MDF2231050.1 DUF2842 domain-containing protein [Albimonas sp. CAU 1670]